MWWLCHFKQCKWLHLFNVRHKSKTGDWVGLIGVYQCIRCKTISKGQPQ